MNFLILGMPNVGKSSLYNLICEDNHNIIHNTDGTTRDWHVSSLKKNKNLKIYDSPGLMDYRSNLVNNKFKNFINKIDIFLYVIDYKKDNYSKDKELINYFRKYEKKIILIVNKDDNYSQNKNLNFFGSPNIFYISCSHNLGIDLFVEFLNQFEEYNNLDEEENFSIGLFGKTNVGKSTLFNKLVGFDRSLVSKNPKTTTDIVNSFFKFNGIKYLIKDTAGLIKKNKIDTDSLDYYATKKTISIIKDIDINLFLIDVTQGFDNQSKKILNIIYNKSNILIILINKIDLIKGNKKKVLLELKKDIQLEFSTSKNIHIIETSAKYDKNIQSLKKKINNITKDININISTSQINMWLNKTTSIQPHSRIKGKEVKFKYATQISSNPFVIKIFSNFSKEILISYRRFLLNNFYESFKIKSKNIRIVFSKSKNPYN